MDRLAYFRKRVDLIDKRIVGLVIDRIKVAQQIGDYKRKNKIKIQDKAREAKVIDNIKKYCDKKNEKVIADIFKRIISHSRKVQK